MTMRRSLVVSDLLLDDVEALVLKIAGQRVDLGVGSDDRLGHGQVGVQEGLRGPIHGGADESGHLDELVVDGVQSLLERRCMRWSSRS